jgi:hypothetical protein
MSVSHGRKIKVLASLPSEALFLLRREHPDKVDPVVVGSLKDGTLYWYEMRRVLTALLKKNSKTLQEAFPQAITNAILHVLDGSVSHGRKISALACLPPEALFLLGGEHPDKVIAPVVDFLKDKSVSSDDMHAVLTRFLGENSEPLNNAFPQEIAQAMIKVLKDKSVAQPQKEKFVGFFWKKVALRYPSDGLILLFGIFKDPHTSVTKKMEEMTKIHEYLKDKEPALTSFKPGWDALVEEVVSKLFREAFNRHLLVVNRLPEELARTVNQLVGTPFNEAVKAILDVLKDEKVLLEYKRRVLMAVHFKESDGLGKAYPDGLTQGIINLLQEDSVSKLVKDQVLISLDPKDLKEFSLRLKRDLEILIKQRLESQFELTGSVGDDLATLKALYPRETSKAIASLLDGNHGQSIKDDLKKHVVLSEEAHEFYATLEKYKEEKAKFKDLESAYSKAKADYQQHYFKVDELKKSKKKFSSPRFEAINSLSTAEGLIAEADAEIAGIRANAEATLKPAVQRARDAVEAQRTVIKPLEQTLNDLKKHVDLVEKVKYSATGKTRKPAQPNYGKTVMTRLRTIF